ncbi:hypothetical protein KM043_001671 [Ampulex compressa]|nr:hypothetical protein KM043_001671 [Ampulex compressa]
MVDGQAVGSAASGSTSKVLRRASIAKYIEEKYIEGEEEEEDARAKRRTIAVIYESGKTRTRQNAVPRRVTAGNDSLCCVSAGETLEAEDKIL